jgi:hypothetical protein
MRLQGSFRRAAQLLHEAESFLIVPHLHPDGDALGSALGLYHALNQMGKTHVVVVSHDPVPEIYRYLPDWEQIRVEHPPPCHLRCGSRGGSEPTQSRGQARAAGARGAKNPPD